MLNLATALATFPVLETGRLRLRAVTPDDTASMFRIMFDPRVTRYFGRAPLASPDEAAQRINEIRAAFQEQRGVRWAITLRVDGQFLGTCGFWRFMAPHDRAEIGYELAPEWWGQGVIPEAARAALGFGFTRLGLHSVEAQIHPDNMGSRRVLEKLGFVQEGYFRENYYDVAIQAFTDTAVFSLLQSDWLQRTAG